MPKYKGFFGLLQKIKRNSFKRNRLLFTTFFKDFEQGDIEFSNKKAQAEAWALNFNSDANIIGCKRLVREFEFQRFEHELLYQKLHYH